MTTAMRACLACQTPLPEEAHFCFQCGAVTPTEEGVPPRAAATSTRQIERVRQALASRGYAIERVLGEGGMATVYLATDGKHRRQVAVKVMRPELAATVGAERFLREVEIAAQLTHPHILPVHDSGEVDGVLYYVMPYVEGESLHDRIKRETQLPVEEALRIAREVSEALAYAHGKRIVHRDIKPGNIMLSAGHALVADFGIARAVDARGGSITGTGLAVGTPQYMSPEQASGSSNIDIRSDIYALGAVLYEMLTGETPFTGPNAQAIIIRLLTETPRALSTSRAGIPAEVEALVQRSLVKNPADRWQSTAEFANALRGAEDQLRLGPISGVRTPAPMPAVATVRSARKLWFSFGLGGVVAVALLYGLVFRGSAGASTKGSGIRLAVLPFENRGAADDSYFVDGVADQVRGKLMNVAGFQIIARSSSDQYRGSKKTPQEIGRELGVDFLLTSTVTWDKSAGGKGRIRVIPELIDVKTGAGTWQQSFDAELTDIFQVQGSIASQVAGALNVALAPVDQERLDARPTRSLEAYDWFLKARAVTSSSPADLRKTIGYYQQAVALDSTFAEAWGQLAYSLSRLYYNSTPLPEIAAEARNAVDRVTRLAPRTAVSLEASSRYKQLVANDVTGAIEDGMAALRLAPNNASMLRLAARLETILGRWPEGLAHAEAAARLDPRGIPTKSSLVRVLIPMRKYPEAIRVLEEIQAESPSLSDFEYLVLANLMQGDLSSARRLIATTPPWTSREELVGYLGLYYDLFWILEAPDQKVLLGLGPERFDGDRASWSLTRMQLHYHRGERALARAWADTARVELQNQLARVPDDPQRNLYLGYTHAVLGHKAEAIAAAERGDSLTSVEKDQDTGAYMRHQLIRIYLVLGENEKALDLLEHLVKIPYFLTPQWLSIDPNFAPLRGNPRFEKLLKGPQTLTF